MATGIRCGKKEEGQFIEVFDVFYGLGAPENRAGTASVGFVPIHMACSRLVPLAVG